MKKITAVLLIAIVFASCKREDPPNTSSGGSLTKLIMTEGGDTTTSTFNYDANNKLASWKEVTVGGGYVDSFSTVMTRDVAGRVIQVSDIENGYPAYITYASYVGTGSQLKTAVSRYMGSPSDSTVYTYNGNMITEMSYYYNSGSYSLQSKTEYTLQNGNPVTTKDYDTYTGTVQSVTTLTFDSQKPAVTRSLEEILLTDLFEPAYLNNVTKFQFSDPSMPNYNETINFTYTYASSGQPLTAQSTSSTSGPITVKYYYK